MTGCQTAQMKTAPALANVAPFVVQGANPRVWNSDISFGPWHTSQVREGLTWSFGYRLLGIEARYAQQPYQVVIASGAARVQSECITRALALSRDGLAVDPAFGKLPALSCGFTGAGEGTLRLNTTASNAEHGEIVFGGERWTLRSVDTFDGSPIRNTEPIGYELSDERGIVAAVEIINSGRVWISPTLSAQQQSRIAALAVVLLLYDPAQTEY
ncbi:MAG TPA: hypothetical protein VIT67_14990 [Povalibacter sp.]